MPKGLDELTWEDTKSEISRILIEIARRGGLNGVITYSDLTTQVTTTKLDPHSPVLASLLGEISEDEDKAGRGMLSVIVVHKRGDMMPGPGFFELAKRLGRAVEDLEKTWVDEINQVHAYWSRKASPTT